MHVFSTVKAHIDSRCCILNHQKAVSGLNKRGLEMNLKDYKKNSLPPFSGRRKDLNWLKIKYYYLER